MIKNIIFDIGKVLLGFDWDEYANSIFDPETADAVTKALWHTGYWSELDRGVLSEEEILQLFYDAAPEYKTEIDKAYNEVGLCVRRRDWAIPMVDSLRDRGYKVYYLSNLSEHIMDVGRHALDFTEHMDGGIFSCHVKSIKPDPAIYLKLIEKYDLIPGECLFIDDHEDNIAVGRALGMKGIIFENQQQLETDLEQALTKDTGHNEITVLCYGDSNTYGYDPSTGSRYPYDKRWTTILQERLGDGYEVVNEGLNGRTTAYDRPGADWKNGIRTLISSMGTHKPIDILIIMLGTNDCIAGIDLDADDITEGMRNLIHAAKITSPELQGYVPEIIIVTPAALRLGAEYSFFEEDPESARMSHELAARYERLAAEELTRHVNAAESADVSVLDGVHLSEEGHAQLAELIYEAITEHTGKEVVDKINSLKEGSGIRP